MGTFWLTYIVIIYFNINKFIPAKSGMFGSWPWSRSFLTWSWSPLMDATCKGVSPRSFLCCLERFRSSSGVGAAELNFGGKLVLTWILFNVINDVFVVYLGGHPEMRFASPEPIVAAPTWALWLESVARCQARALSRATATSTACFEHNHVSEHVVKYITKREINTTLSFDC